MKHEKKLSRAERAEKKRKRRNLVMGSTLAFLMVFSVLAFAIGSQFNPLVDSIEFNGYVFTPRQVQGGFLLFADIGGEEIGFYSDPYTTTSQVSLPPDIRDVLVGADTIYFTSKPSTTGDDLTVDTGLYEFLVRDLQRFSGKNVVRGQTEMDLFQDYNVINCYSATQSSPVILLEPDELSGEMLSPVDGEEYCYNFNIVGQDVILVRDYMILLLRGII